MAKATLAGLLGLANDQKGLRFWEIIAIASYAIGSFLIGLYSLALKDLRAFGILTLVAGAAWGAGAILGFLFGVPRLRSQTGQQALSAEHAQFTPNTNLEQISDWLTKIIVGATLVQLNAVAARFQTTAEYVGASIGVGAAAAPVSGAVMIYFSTAGFMWGYLWCSFRIFREMIHLAQETDGEDETIPDLPPLAPKPDAAKR